MIRPSALAVLLVLVAACKRETPKRELPPALQEIASGFDEIRRTTTFFVLAISADRYEDAYTKLCPGVRAGISLDAFTTAVRANAYLHGATKADEMKNGRFAIDGDTSVEPMTIESTAGTIRADAYLSHDQHVWCITGISLGGAPALPAPRK